MRHSPNMEEVAKLPIDMMGFIFYPTSPRHAEGILEKSALLNLPSSLQKVGVFVNNDLQETLNTLEKYSLQFAQLHGSETPEYCERVKDRGYNVIKVFSVDQNMDFGTTKKFEGLVDYFLFDTKSPKHGGTGEKFDWDILQKYKGSEPVFLSGGILPTDGIQILEIVDKFPWVKGVDLNSRFEFEPGLKDTQKLDLFIHTLKQSRLSRRQ